MAIFNRCDCKAFNSHKSKVCKRCNKKLGKNFYVQYSVEGKRKTERIGDSIGFAREVLAKRQTDVREGKFFGNTKSIHWVTFFDKYYKKYREDNLTVFEGKRYRTARDFKDFQKDMTKITRLDIENYRLHVDNGKRTKSTINRYMHVVRFAFNYAESLDLIDQNPARKLKMYKEEPSERRVVSADDEIKLIESAKQSKSPLIYHFIMIALYTGMRFSELLDLKWSNVSFEMWSFMLYKTKNNEIREIHIIDKLKPVLDDLSSLTGDYEYLFSDPETGEKAKSVRKAFEKAVERAEIGKLTIHELRHTMVTRLAASGASIPEIQQISGHKTAKMVQRYTHVGLSESKRTIDRLSKFLEGGDE